MRSTLTILVMGALLVACNSPFRIDTAVTQCCPDNGHETFSVAAEDIPAFLGPLVVSNFAVAFAAHGMQPVDDAGDADLIVMLRYEQDDFSEPRQRDDFEEPMGSAEPMRFLARIVIEVRDPEHDMIVWSGHIQRLHDAGPGDFMHTRTASIAIYEAFAEVLKDYR